MIRDRSLFANGAFVAVDGEGIDVGSASGGDLRALSPRFGARAPYRSRAHNYRYLALSSGHVAEADSGNIPLAQIIETLFRAASDVDRPIFVGFGLVYDFTQWVSHDLTREQVRRLVSGSKIWYGEYRIELRLRHYFRVWRERPLRRDCVTVWDVWGFFRSTFVRACEEWLGVDYRWLPIIRRGKAARGSVIDAEYNRAELIGLVDLMSALRVAVAETGLKLRRWDGAGAIASELLRQGRVRPHLGERLPIGVQRPVLGAYFGGRIEACKIGARKGEGVYRYDINAAYPSALAGVPSFGAGEWQENDSGNAVLQFVRWSFPPAPFYPLMLRMRRERGDVIVAPADGAGWHWKSEVAAAGQFAKQVGGTLAVERSLSWRSDIDARPFRWIADLHAARRSFEASGQTGAARAIKAGMNALWGKTCQRHGFYVDADGELHEPPWWQPAWAGMVTAEIHARLIFAALERPDAIVAFCTDGLISTERLRMPIGDKIGEWREEIFGSLLHAASGVYWMRPIPQSPGREYVATKGFSSSLLAAADVRSAWRNNVRQINLKLQRFVGAGAAIQSETAWRERGRFVRFARHLAIDGGDGKRHSVGVDRLRRLASDLLALDHASWYGADAVSDLPAVDWLGEEAGEFGLDDIVT